MLLSLYRACSAGFAPAAPWLLLWRAKLRRARLRPEDRLRIKERLGQPSASRPPGRLAWLHGANAADVTALLPLIDRLGAAGFIVLTTTRGDDPPPRLPPAALHQFAPLDAPRFVTRFLAFWRPAIALVAGCELWPNLIAETRRRGIAVAVVNGRLPARAFLLWRKFPGAARALFGEIDECLTVSAADNQRFHWLGLSRAQVVGDTVYDFAPAPPDETALARLSARIGARPVWAAFPADAAEEDVVIEAHRDIARNFHDLLTIVAPRNAMRGFDIALRAGRLGLNARVAAPNERDDAALPSILVAGAVEAGLLYRAAGVIFLGRSLETPFGKSIGGLNPIESAKLGCAILHGPETDDFSDAYAALNAAGGSALVYDARSLASEVSMLLLDSAETREMGRAAAAAVDRLGGASARIMRIVAPYLAQTSARPTIDDETEL